MSFRIGANFISCRPNRPYYMIYFASDFHLSPDIPHSKEEEAHILSWLDEISRDATRLFLMGDVFDFWFEYRQVVPKGHVRLLGRLARMADEGLDIHFFPGNHDQWTFGYLREEIGMQVHHQPEVFELMGKTFFLGHGDGLGPGDYGYKRIKKLFGNSIARWIFRWIHPDLGVRLARLWSKTSRKKPGQDQAFSGKENEWLYQFANNHPEKDRIDYFIFGHRHIPMDLLLDNHRTRYINLGEWMHARSFARFDGQELTLGFYKNEGGKVIRGDNLQ